VEHGELVAQNKDLQVFCGIIAGQQHQEADHAADSKVDESG
jgi:hypothetical protein